MRHRSWYRARPVGDFAAALLSLYGAFRLRIQVGLPFTADLLPADRLHFFEESWVLVLLTQVLTLYFLGFYDQQRPPSHLARARGLAVAVSLQALLLMGYFFLTLREFPRSVLLVFVPLNFLLLYAWRSLIARLHRPRLRRVVIVGHGPAACELAEKIAAHHWHGLAVAGHVALPGEETADLPLTDHPALGELLGSADALPALLATGRVDDVILAPSTPGWQTRMLDRLAGTRPAGSNVLLLPGPFESLIGRTRYRWVQDLPLVEVVGEGEWQSLQPLKRGLDLVLASVLLVLGSPLMLACAAAIRLSSPGPALYRQVRIGRGQKPFTLWKFRTMKRDAEKGLGEVLAQPNDPRSTSVGAFLRRSRLDELPQLFNVLGGSMSLVGPRPERPGFVERYLREVPGYAERFSVPPGLTGLAQVNGEYHSSPENKLRYDLAYLANRSVWLDLAILVSTVKIVLTSRGT